MKSPWLGMSFIQENRYLNYTLNDKYRTNHPTTPYYLVELALAAEPFKITLPSRSNDDELKIAIWTDESIFNEVKRGIDIKKIPFFCGGCGLAHPMYGPFDLFVTNEGFNYFFETRLGTEQQVNNISVSKFVNPSWSNDFKEQRYLYMVALIDINNHGTADHSEYEFFKIFIN